MRRVVIHRSSRSSHILARLDCVACLGAHSTSATVEARRSPGRLHTLEAHANACPWPLQRTGFTSAVRLVLSRLLGQRAA
jgi:hypothetical protein